MFSFGLVAVLAFSSADSQITSALKAPPTVPAVRRAIERSLPFLEKSSTAWRTQRKCVTCHQVPFALWPLNEGRVRGFPVEKAKWDALTDWAFQFCTTDKYKGEFTGGFHLTMVFMVLSQRAATPSRTALKGYEFFEPLFAKRQRADGSWREGRQIRIKGAQREADEVDTMWTVLALAALEKLGDRLPARTRQGLARQRQRALVYLKGARPGRRLDGLALQMLVARAYGPPARARVLLKELRALQNPDGGWGYVRGGTSYPHTTGECLHALARMGVKGADPAVQKAWKYLLLTQRADGSWKALSRENFSNNPAKTHKIAIHWGTGWATLGLLYSLPEGRTPLKGKPVKPVRQFLSRPE